MFVIAKAADLEWLMQGGQLYSAFSFSKVSLASPTSGSVFTTLHFLLTNGSNKPECLFLTSIYSLVYFNTIS